MLVPLSITVTAILLCSGLAFFAGFCLGCVRPAPDEDLRPQVMAYAAKVEELERPKLIEWSPATMQRFRLQQEASRQIARRRTA